LNANGTYSTPAGSGTVTAVSVASANGFTGTSSGGATPALTLATSITGVLKGNGTAISAAAAGTDYQAPITLTTTGSSGPATFISNVLNIPSYTGGGGSGSAVTDTITQTAHGFTVGQVLKFAGGVYALAKADSAANAEVVGIVSSVTSANIFVLTTNGYVTGLSGLTANTTYFLDPVTAGLLTATEPITVGQVSKPLLDTDSTTSGYFTNMRGLVITAPTALTSAHIFVGNASNLPADVAVTGDIGISNTGVTTIGANKVTYTKVYNGLQLAEVAAMRFLSGN
jgi:hypothetical protein